MDYCFTRGSLEPNEAKRSGAKRCERSEHIGRITETIFVCIWILWMVQILDIVGGE